MMKPNGGDRRISRTRMYFLIYVAIFGVIWGLGASVLAGTLPPEPITRVLVFGWFDMIILFLTKIIIRHPLSATFALTIAGTISIFTFSFGPPNPYKWLFLFAGLAFDAGTLFRTTKLRYWNLLTGMALYIPTIYAIFAGIAYLLDPGIFWSVVYFIPVAAGIYLIEGLIASALLWRFLGPGREPARVAMIWRQLGILS